VYLALIIEIPFKGICILDILATNYGSIKLTTGSLTATNSRGTGENLPVSINNSVIENDITQRDPQYNIENMSGNEFRAMANELYEKGNIDTDTHENMIRSLLFSTDLGETGLGEGTYVAGTHIHDQNKKINMFEHFQTVLSEQKENIKKFNLSYDIKPYEQIVSTLEELNVKYNSPRVNLTA
jgi:ketopantoate reductase